MIHISAESCTCVQYDTQVQYDANVCTMICTIQLDTCLFEMYLFGFNVLCFFYLVKEQIYCLKLIKSTTTSTITTTATTTTPPPPLMYTSTNSNVVVKSEVFGFPMPYLPVCSH